ncbi:MAG: glycine zipper 2TM domain-containing protein [Thermoanaerobaculales bacterium]|jgi:outer membrane lipoprotein SlyB|nr:glycine zipper 2TM domain-containing protein [Thermoanaerobaculales bacterium]
MKTLSMWRGPTLWTVLSAVLVTMALMPLSPAEAQSQTMQRILYGEVVSAERITIRDAPTGRGAQAGSTVGAVAGYALADGRDRWLGALVGGVLGGAAGNAAEKAKKKKPGWELIIRLENGEEIGVQVPMNKKNRAIYKPGDRVRMMSGPNGQTKVTKVE